MMQENADIVIIGGGIVGLMTARLLAREGADVLLIEAGDLGAEASGANAGSIHLQIQYPEFVSYGEDWARAYTPCLRFLKTSLALWQDLPGELWADLGVTLAGGLIAARTEAQMAHIRAKSVIEAEAGIETRILGRDDLLRLAPYLSSDAIGGGFCPLEGKANPLQVTPHLAGSAAEAGARIVTHTRVTGIARQTGAYVVETPRGAVRTGRIVNAAGAFAGRIGAMLGTHLDIDGFPLQVTVTEPVAAFIPHLVYSAAGKLSLKQLANGGCVIGGGWPARERGNGVLVTDPKSLSGNMGMAAGVVPAIAASRALRSWTAWVNGTPDWRPILGEDPNAPGVIHALFPWVGFSAGPMTATVAAALALGRPSPVGLKGLSLLYD
ncbi:NAD(P)/FAD-dependent oxidoreductase [Ovoidimarina sediminis]|uniref:NAD(P)/FAD-dependent oxidoreductase n=1 Tax=Ovoidimarina sediminis TaxID=3079856 RepID=UPI002914D4E1|nr:FAD-dependent oxidoreductase [Rhodophyticola sp. MJ-SS7]MDU8944233.1 FAD-dependent oxidoreductase [Rhodophyticola sp. MJ-SS7]